MRRIAVRRAAGAAVLVAVAGLVTACGGDDADEVAGQELGRSSPSRRSRTPAARTSTWTSTVRTSPSSPTKAPSRSARATCPDSFPDDLSVPDGDVVSSIDTPEGSSVTLDVDDAVAAFDEALADLEANGWTRETVTESGETRMAVLSKDGGSAMVMGDTSASQLTYTMQRGLTRPRRPVVGGPCMMDRWQPSPSGDRARPGRGVPLAHRGAGARARRGRLGAQRGRRVGAAARRG